jgi:MFS family permease
VSAGQSAAVVGVAFAVNGVTVIVCQLPVLRLARGRRRTAAVVALSALWAAAWALVLAGSHLGGGLAVPLFVLAAVAFGLGETLFAPSVPAMVNDIAPEALRGRYNGGSAFAYTVGFALGPASAGLLLEHRLGSQLLAGLMAGCAAAALLAMSARRRIPATADIIDPPAPGSAPPLPDHREILA